MNCLLIACLEYKIHLSRFPHFHVSNQPNGSGTLSLHHRKLDYTSFCLNRSELRFYISHKKSKLKIIYIMSKGLEVLSCTRIILLGRYLQRVAFNFPFYFIHGDRVRIYNYRNGKFREAISFTCMSSL